MSPRDPETIRSFVGVPLPEPVRAEIVALTTRLAPRLPSVKWVRKPENMHVTLRFLGQFPVARVDALGAALGDAVASLAPFAVEVRGVGAFRSPRAAQVIWVGVADPDGKLARVARVVQQVTSAHGAAGPPGEADRPFTAHVTVGRAKPGVDAREALAAATDQRFGDLRVEEVHLYESRPGREGSTYFVRAGARLAG